MKSEVQSVTRNKSKTNMGCEAGKHQGCVKKYTNSTNNGGGKIKNGGAQVDDMVRPNFYSN